MRQDAFGLTFFNHTALPHHGHAVGHLGHHVEVVGDEKQCQSALVAQTAQQFQNARLHRDIEGRRWLIGNEQGRVTGEREGNHHALFLSAAQLMRIALVDRLRIGQFDLSEEVNHHGMRRFARKLSVQAHRLGHLFTAAHRRIERTHRLLEDHGDATTAQRFSAGEIAEQRNRLKANTSALNTADALG